ncbi:GNAT family N-acetyltransferase [Vibrio fluvialis]|uniref:GNAT family N-acetyltransferase n=1 Tax=Vibrio fluvialis TaxID=676 RepID=UPI0015597212|nr:GNAT family N-acetyltransferase [Vibrio fluvialis]
MQVVQATSSDLSAVAELFDAYRQFYNQPANLSAARDFIAQRLDTRDSVIFVMQHDSELLGFAQLYPSFSSVAMKRMWYLNDLFVASAARRQGVAGLLLTHIRHYAKETQALTVKLATAVDNEQAKALYESHGYVKVTAFDHYTQRVE